MAFTILGPTIVPQAIADTSTTALVTLGTIVRGVDTATSGLGGAEFIYLLGVGSTVVGSVVIYSTTTYQTALATNTADQADCVAVAMSANTSGYGWYQIEGLATVACVASRFAPSAKVYLSGTSGKITSTSGSGKAILGANAANLTTGTTTGTTATVLINRPHLQARTN